MSKRSSFERIPRDLYETIDSKAIPPNFLKHIAGKRYYEPCCGSGKLIEQLNPHATCVWASDVEPLNGIVASTKDGLDLTEEDVKDCDLLISNPPYKKDLLLPLIDHWTSLRPTWLLLPSDIMHNSYMKPYMEKCERVISIGRLYWFINEWVTKEPFDHSELDKSWDKSVEYYDMMTGTKYFTGYLTNQGKPCKTKFVRGTDNYCWMLFTNEVSDTIYETRGD